MRIFLRILNWLYVRGLRFYPKDFHTEFGGEMEILFAETSSNAGNNALKLLTLFGREVRDLPKAILREYLRYWKGIIMNQDNLTWRPLSTKELLLGLAIFVLPILGGLVTLAFGHEIGNPVASGLLLTTLILTLGVLIFAVIKGFPRWTLPYLGISVVSLVMLQGVYPIWGLFSDNVRDMVKYSTRTLAARIQYAVLLDSFFWLVPFIAIILVILFFMIWPSSRKLARRIRRDWTLMSFMVYSALIFDLELILDEYAFDEGWKIASRICLVLGAYFYFKSADQRKRIVALLVGATLFYGFASAGQWIVLPKQSWTSFYGNDHWTYRRVMLSGDLAGWASVLILMLIPWLITRMPRSQKIDNHPEKGPIPV